MKKYFSIIICLLIVTNLKSQTPQFSWAKQLGGSYAVQSLSIAVDQAENVYTTGCYYNLADFDPGTPTYNLTSNGGSDVFISKLDKHGNFKWAKSIGGIQNDFGMAITTDSFGNIYTTGIFVGTVDLNPNAGTQTVTALGADMFIIKLDSSGNFIWAKSVGGHVESYSIKTDKYGNIYTSGHFNNTSDFDPGTGINNLTASGSLHRDVFILKLNSNGDFQWAKNLGGDSIDGSSSLSIDMSGNVYSTGIFSDTADFDPGLAVYNLISSNNSSAYINKLDSMGNFIWAKQIIGNSGGQSIKSDLNGNVYIVGFFTDTADFDTGSSIFNLISVGNDDMFILKLDSSGNFLWAKQIGGTYKNIYYGLGIDYENNIYTSCIFNGIIDVDPNVGVVNLNSNSNYDAFILKLDSNGSYKWAGQLEGSQTKWPHSVFVDNNLNIYITGHFSQTADFNPDSVAVFNLTSKGSVDVFILKLTQKSINQAIPENPNFELNSIYPNPTNGLINISLLQAEQNFSVKVFNSNGVLMYHDENLTNKSAIDLSQNSPGLYILKVYKKNKILYYKLIIE